MSRQKVKRPHFKRHYICQVVAKVYTRKALYWTTGLSPAWFLPPRIPHAFWDLLEPLQDGLRVMITWMNQLHHVNHSASCFFQVEGLLIPSVLVPVQLLDCIKLCWWSLSAKSDRRLYPQKNENHTSYSHIFITNLAPQLFWRFYHFRSTSPE